MKNFWKRQSKTKKIIAFALAFLLALVPLVSYIGPRTGAKAANDSYTFALGEVSFKYDEESGNIVPGTGMEAEKSFGVPGSILGEEEGAWTYDFTATVKDEDGSLAEQEIKLGKPAFYLGGEGEFSVDAEGNVTGGTKLEEKVQLADGSKVYLVVSATKGEEAPVYLTPVTVTVKKATELGVPVWNTKDDLPIDENAYYSPDRVKLGGVSYSGIGTTKYTCGTIEDATIESELEGWKDSSAVAPEENEDGWYGYVGVFVENELVEIKQTTNKVKIDGAAPELSYALTDPEAEGVTQVDDTIYFNAGSTAPGLTFTVTDERNADGTLEATSGKASAGTLSEDQKSKTFTWTAPASIAESTGITFTGTDLAGNTSAAKTVTFEPVNRRIHFVGTPVYNPPATDGNHSNQKASLSFTVESYYGFGDFTVKSSAIGSIGGISDTGAIGNSDSDTPYGNHRKTVEVTLPMEDPDMAALKSLKITVSDQGGYSDTYSVGDTGYLYDTTKPVITDCRLEKLEGGSFVPVKPKENQGDVYHALAPKDGEYRFTFSVTDPANNVDDSKVIGILTGDGEEQVLTPVRSGSRYVCVVNLGPGISTFTAGATDRAGNVAENKQANYRIKKVDDSLFFSEIKIEDKNGKKITVAEVRAGVKTNVAYVFKIKMESSYPVLSMSIADDSGFYTEAEDIKLESVDEDERYIYSGSMTVPVEEINRSLTNLTLTVTDGKPEASNVRTRTLGSLVYDNTKPTITDAAGKKLGEDANWYKSYDLSVKVENGSTADVETDLAEAGYVISNSDKDVKDGVLEMAEDKKSATGTVSVPQSKTADGTKITFFAKDDAGNELDSGNVAVVRVDTENPAVTKLSVNGGSDIKKGVVTVDTEVSDNLSIGAFSMIAVNAATGKQVTLFEKKYNEAETKIVRSPSVKVDTKKLTDGSWTIRATVKDMAGNRSLTRSRKIEVDNKAPVVDVRIISGIHGRENYYRGEGVMVKLTCSDKNIDVNDIYATDYGMELSPNWKKIRDDLYEAILPVTDEGDHYFMLSATDIAGNQAKDAEMSFVIDQSAPTVDEVAFGDIEATENTALAVPFKGNVTMSLALGDDFSLDMLRVVVTNPEGKSYVIKNYSLNADGQGEVTESADIDIVTRKGNKNLYDGTWKVNFTITDYAGNRTSAGSYIFKVDNTVPVVTAKVASGVGGGKRPMKNFDGSDYDYYNRSDVAVQLTVQDDNLKDTVVTDKLGDVVTTITPTWVANEAGGLTATVNITGDGRHTVTINAEDFTGNKAEPMAVEFVRDTGLPIVNASLNGAVYTDGSTVDLTGNASVVTSVSDLSVDPEDLNFRAVVKRPDQGEVVSAAKTQANRSFDFTEEADYTLELYAIDLAGNQGPVRSVNFRIDHTAPQLTITGVEDSNKPVTVTFNMVESFWWDMRDAVISVNGSSEGFTAGSASSSMTKTFDQTGEYSITFTATDRAGNTASVSAGPFVVDTDAPEILLQAKYDGASLKNYDAKAGNITLEANVTDKFINGEDVTLKGWVQDIDGKKTELAYNDFRAGVKLEEEFKDDGIYHFEVTAKDKAGNSEEGEVNFTIDKTPPIIGDLTKYKGNENGYLTAFKWDEDMDTFVKDLTVCDTHVYLNGKEYDGATVLEDGAYTLRVESADQLNNVAEPKEVSFILDTKAPEFIVTGVENGEEKDEPYTITISLQLEEDILTKVTLNDEEVPISNNGAMITVSEKGDYVLHMEATDLAGNVRNDKNDDISFTYGTKMNILPFIIGGAGGLAALLLVLVLVLKRKQTK